MAELNQHSSASTGDTNDVGVTAQQFAIHTPENSDDDTSDEENSDGETYDEMWRSAPSANDEMWRSVTRRRRPAMTRTALVRTSPRNSIDVEEVAFSHGERDSPASSQTLRDSLQSGFFRAANADQPFTHLVSVASGSSDPSVYRSVLTRVTQWQPPADISEPRQSINAHPVCPSAPRLDPRPRPPTPPRPSSEEVIRQLNQSSAPPEPEAIPRSQRFPLSSDEIRQMVPRMAEPSPRLVYRPPERPLVRVPAGLPPVPHTVPPPGAVTRPAQHHPPARPGNARLPPPPQHPPAPIANKLAAVDVSRMFSPRMIGSALAKLWVVNGQKLDPLVCLSGDVVCPITLEPIRAPAMVCDGSVYEEAAILQWLQSNNKAPCTNLPLEHRAILRLKPLKEAFEHFLSRDDMLKPCPEKVLQYAIREATTSNSSPLVKVKQLESHIDGAAREVERLQVLISNAKAVAGQMNAEIDARKPICATRIQACIRGFHARHEAAVRREILEVARQIEAEILEKRQIEAATIIQNSWRNHQRHRRIAAATSVQKHWRKRFDRQIVAATTIQQHWRDYQSHRRIAAATFTQNNWRNHIDPPIATMTKIRNFLRNDQADRQLASVAESAAATAVETHRPNDGVPTLVLNALPPQLRCASPARRRPPSRVLRDADLAARPSSRMGEERSELRYSSPDPWRLHAEIEERCASLAREQLSGVECLSPGPWRVHAGFDWDYFL